MASPTQWTWVWINSRSWWWTGRPGVLQFMGSQRVRHDWATELNWTELNHKWVLNFVKGFFCIYWDYHMVFIFKFFNIVYHIDWFAYIEESLHSWNKTQLDHGVWALWCVAKFCLLKFLWGFFHLCSSVILACSFLFLCFICLVLVSGWWWTSRMTLEMFLPLHFFKRVLEIQAFSSVTQLCSTLCDPMDHSTPGLPVHQQLPEFTQTHVHWVGDAIQPSHPLSSPSPPALNLFQH